jgi:hypothetical protein
MIVKCLLCCLRTDECARRGGRGPSTGRTNVQSERNTPISDRVGRRSIVAADALTPVSFVISHENIYLLTRFTYLPVLSSSNDIPLTVMMY